MVLNREELRTLKNFCKENSKGTYITDIMNKLESEIAENEFPNLDLLMWTVKKLIDATDNYYERYNLTKDIVKLICTTKDNKEYYESIYKQTIDILSASPEYFKNFSDMDPDFLIDIVTEIYNIFSKKEMYLETLKQLCGISNYKITFKIIEYMNKQRCLYIDEAGFKSAITSLIFELDGVTKKDKIDEIFKKRIDLDNKLAGVNPTDRYEIDRMWESFAKILEEFKKISGESTLLTDRVTQYKDLIEKLYKEIAKAVENAINNISVKEKESIFEIGKSKIDALGEIKKALNDMSIEMTKFKQELEGYVDLKIGGLENRIIDKATEMFGYRIDELLKEYRDKLDKVVLSELSGKGAPGVIIKGKNPIEPHPILPLFESSAKAADKARELISNKKQGEIYHPKYDSICKLLTLDQPIAPVILVGPSGSGKSHSVEQSAEASGLRYYKSSYVSEEYSLIGFKDVNSNYDWTPFYLAYKYGGIFNFEEIDNSHPGAIVLLNLIIGTSKNSSFTFPNGETVKQHKYFRITGTANTWLNSGDEQYSTKTKFDAGTSNRFKKIFYDYDERIEKLLAPDAELHSFIRAFRTSCVKSKILQVTTYRDFMDISRLINEAGFSVEEALTINLIMGNSQDILDTIVGGMKNCANNQYYKVFSKLKAQV